jgi:glycerol uptake facilitator-like aquaporin
MIYDKYMTKKLIAEFFGTLMLLTIVTGSGIMGASLGQGNDAVALLGNSIATGCGLYVLISLLGPISGAHFNPVVSLAMWRVDAMAGSEVIGYVVTQLLGAITGVWLTHLMFNLPVLQLSQHARSGLSQGLSETVSTLVLLGVIYIGIRVAKDKIPMLVALTVTAGYWFTSSTFFANPAVTLARCLTDTFVGIAPHDAPMFIAAQLLGLVAWVVSVKFSK